MKMFYRYPAIDGPNYGRGCTTKYSLIAIESKLKELHPSWTMPEWYEYNIRTVNPNTQMLPHPAHQENAFNVLMLTQEPVLSGDSVDPFAGWDVVLMEPLSLVAMSLAIYRAIQRRMEAEVRSANILVQAIG